MRPKDKSTSFKVKIKTDTDKKNHQTLENGTTAQFKLTYENPHITLIKWATILLTNHPNRVPGGRTTSDN
jgi:hypothetical protein